MSRAALAHAAPKATETQASHKSRGLQIGEADDAFEREADNVAASVMNGRPARWSLGALSLGAPLQRKCDCGGEAEGKCEHCQESRRALQRKASDASATPTHAPPSVDVALHSGGRPLEPAARNFMENRFGRSFADVRIHDGDSAARSALEVRAAAYTVGKSIVFGAGRYLPHTTSGRGLLAHELAHVVQQNGGGVGRSLQRDPLDALSEEDKRRLARGNADCSSNRCHPSPNAKGAFDEFGMPATKNFSVADAQRWVSGDGQPQPKAPVAKSQPAAHVPEPVDDPKKLPPLSASDAQQFVAPQAKPKPRPHLTKHVPDANELMRASSHSMSDEDIAAFLAALEKQRREDAQKMRLADGTMISLAPPAEKPVIPAAKPGERTRDLTVDLGGKPVVLSPANVEGERARLIRNMDADLRRISGNASASRTAAQRFLNDGPIMRRIADLLASAAPPEMSIWLETDKRIAECEAAIAAGNLELALERVGLADKALRNAQATWGRYKEKNLGGAEVALKGAEATRDGAKMALMGLATIASGGTAALVATLGTAAIDVTDAFARAQLGEKVDWTKIIVQIGVQLVMQKVGGKIGASVLQRMLRDPRATGIADHYIAEAVAAVINGAEGRAVSSYTDALIDASRGKALTLDELAGKVLESAFEPKSMAYDVILALAGKYAKGVGKPALESGNSSAKPARQAGGPRVAPHDERTGGGAPEPDREIEGPAVREPGARDEAPAAGKPGKNTRGIEPSEVEAEATVEDLAGSGEKHKTVVGEKGIGRCSEPPCILIDLEYAKELADHPQAQKRYAEIEAQRLTDPAAAAKESASLVAVLELCRARGASDAPRRPGLEGNAPAMERFHRDLGADRSMSAEHYQKKSGDARLEALSKDPVREGKFREGLLSDDNVGKVGERIADAGKGVGDEVTVPRVKGTEKSGFRIADGTDSRPVPKRPPRRVDTGPIVGAEDRSHEGSVAGVEKRDAPIPVRAGETDKQALDRVLTVITKKVSEVPALAAVWDDLTLDLRNRRESIGKEKYIELYAQTQVKFWERINMNKDPLQAAARAVAKPNVFGSIKAETQGMLDRAAAANEVLDKAGLGFDPKKGNAARIVGGDPRLEANEITVSLDHIKEKAQGDNWKLALDPDNLELTFSMPNSNCENVQVRHKTRDPKP